MFFRQAGAGLVENWQEKTAKPPQVVAALLIGLFLIQPAGWTVAPLPALFQLI